MSKETNSDSASVDPTNMNESSGLTAEQVSDYLQQNPDFFKHHESLLTEISIPHQQAGAISLVERQTSLLRKENKQFKEQMAQLIDTARYNDVQFEKCRRLVVNLLEAHSMDELIVSLEEGLCQDFNGDVVQLVVFSEDKTLKANGLEVLTPAVAKKQLSTITDSDWAVCGSLEDKQRQALFPSKSEQVMSAAIVPLVRGNNIGVLAIGSYQANYFHSGMGTLFLNYIGEVLSRVVYRLAGFTELEP